MWRPLAFARNRLPTGAARQRTAPYHRAGNDPSARSASPRGSTPTITPSDISPWPPGSVRNDQHVDREVLRCPAFGWRAAHDLSERRAELLLHEALEGLARVPDVVDVVALLALAGAVCDQPLRRLVFPHRGGVPEHLLGDVVVDLLRELGRCRQDSNRHLASYWFRGRRILGRYVQAGRQWSLQVENGRAIDQ